MSAIKMHYGFMQFGFEQGDCMLAKKPSPPWELLYLTLEYAEISRP